MLYRVLLMSLFSLLIAAFVSTSKADDPRTTDLNDGTVQRSEGDGRICRFKFLLGAKYASPEQVKKLLAPCRVLDIRESRRDKTVVTYLVLFYFPGDKTALEKKLFLEDLPEDHRDRIKREDILLTIIELPDSTKLPSKTGKK